MSGRRGNGEGGIYQRKSDGLWVAAIDIGWDSGKRVRKAIYGKSQGEVLAKLRKMQRTLDAGLPILDERRTTRDYLNWWVTEVLPGTVRDSTADSYRDHLDRYVIPHVGNTPLAKLGPEHVQKMIRALEAQGLGPRTRQYARAILRRALTHAERWSLVSRNAAALVESPKLAGHRTDDALTSTEARALLAAAKGNRLETLIVLTLAVGVRKGEALALKWSDLDLDQSTLTVRGTLKRRVGHGLIIDPPKTDRGRRTVPLPAVVVASLRDQRRRQAGERLAAGPEWTDSGHVFATPTGTPLDPRNLTRAYHELSNKAGLGPRRFYALRHSAATLMLEMGVPLEVISATLGHAGYAITADVYAHVGTKLQRQAADAMDRMVSGLSNG